MMFKGLQHFWIAFLFLPFIFPQIVFEDQKYVASFSHVKCTTNSNYVRKETVKCYVVNKSYGTVQFQMKKSVKDLRLDLSVIFDKFQMLNVKSLNGCEFLAGAANSVPIISIYKEILLRSGSLPKGCPIDENYNFNFVNVSLEQVKIPFFIKETTFKIALRLYDTDVFFYGVDTDGRILFAKNKMKKKH